MTFSLFLFGLLDRFSPRTRVARNSLGKANSASFGGAIEKLPAFLIFSATIGEINAIKALIKSLVARYAGKVQIVFITREKVYGELVKKEFPDGAVIDSDSSSYLSLRREFDRYDVKALLIAEGPALFLRFSMLMPTTMPFLCHSRGKPVFVVNAAIYTRHSPPFLRGNRLLIGLYDLIFYRAFLETITHWFAPYPQVAKNLIDGGADPARVSVSGDTKFDLISPIADDQAACEVCSAITDHTDPDKPIVVAGSITSAEEVEALVDAWIRLADGATPVTMIIAPRRIHDEVNMRSIEQALRAKDVRFVNRSEIDDAVDTVGFIILDTFGELAQIYRLSSVCFIGRNHGLIEPMFFGKPVVVGPSRAWVNTGARPQYDFLVSEGAVWQLDSYEELADAIMQLATDPVKCAEITAVAGALVSTQRDATSRVLAEIAQRVGMRGDA